uniref:HECT domain-containing protein n=1 Tax=Oryzias melastigma TaxID=30732 RepID=A0A3B3BUV5_ORYME
ISCGYVGTVSVDKKDLIISYRAALNHESPSLEQLRKGLHLYNLVQLMERNPELCRPMFLPGDVGCVIYVVEKGQPDFCDKNSMKFAREVNVMNFFNDFFSDDDSQQLSDAKVMQSMTGQGHKSVLPNEKKDFVIFVKCLHGCGEDHTTCSPTVSACSRTKTFPVAHLTSYKEFKNIMETAICHGQGFYRI